MYAAATSEQTQKVLDEAIAAVKTVQQQLRKSAYPQVRNLCCDIDNGVIVMRGRVPSYFLKQVAQSALLGVADTVKIDNQVSVYDTE